MSDFITPPNQHELPRWYQDICRIINKRSVVVPSDSTAVDVAGIVSDFNDLLAALRTAFE